MRKFVATVFDNSARAYDGQHALWQLDGEASITVHGTAVVHRDNYGQLIVDTDDSIPPGIATAIGTGLGALVGALAGPAGAVAGAVGAGAALGATGGLVADIIREDVEDQAGFEAGFVINRGQYAVIADVNENWTGPIDNAIQRLGGKVFRRSRSAMKDDVWDYPWDNYLYPYEYRPSLYA